MGRLRIKILVMIVAIIGKHTCNAFNWEEIRKRACKISPELNPWCPTTTVKPSECLNGIENFDCQFGENDKDKRGYIGETSQTVSGLTCQAWNVQRPHKHEFGRLGDHNYCRNPDGESGVWCYTTNPDKRWEYCDVRECNGCDKGFSNATFCSAHTNGHTMRLYAGPSKECAKRIRFRGFTDAGKNLIVKTHNELRQKVAAGLEIRGNQPGASNMMKLVWNDEIAATAQRWTDQCLGSVHDNLRGKCDGTGVGQNLFLTNAHRTEDQLMASVDEAVKAWYSEVKTPNAQTWESKPFPSSSIQPFKLDKVSGGTYGHYTQLVWSNTAEVGCGLTWYERQERKGDFITLIVCNYAVMGNVPGLPMYKIGKGCSDCPKGTTCDQTYDSLCAGRCETYDCQ